MNLRIPFIKSLLFLSLLFWSVQAIKAQTVVVPASDKARLSPLAFNASSAKEGEISYGKNCQSCHGTPGKGDFLKALNPPPGDPAGEKFQKNTDGELFYKISEGNPIMPKFKTTLSEDERWKLVAYIRSFNKNYVQPAVQKAAANLVSKTVRIVFRYDATSKQIILQAKGLLKTDSVPLKGADALLFVKRYFGNLPIGASAKTDETGSASFDFSKGIPGDPAGMIVLEARINDATFGEVIQQSKVKMGIPTNQPPLNAKRAIWNVNRKAPIWLILTYLTIVIGVWSTIGYIVYNIFKIKKLSTDSQS